jgi:hypothetical protein
MQRIKGCLAIGAVFALLIGLATLDGHLSKQVAHAQEAKKPTPVPIFSCKQVGECSEFMALKQQLAGLRREFDNLKKDFDKVGKSSSEKVCLIHGTTDGHSPHLLMWLVTMPSEATKQSCATLMHRYLPRLPGYDPLQPQGRLVARLGCLNAAGVLSQSEAGQQSPDQFSDERIVPPNNFCGW